jgi:hypothetical protein
MLTNKHALSSRQIFVNLFIKCMNVEKIKMNEMYLRFGYLLPLLQV